MHDCVITWGGFQPELMFIHDRNTHAVAENTNPCFLVSEHDVHAAPEVVYPHAEAPHTPTTEVVQVLLVLIRQRQVARNVCENIDPYPPHQTHSAEISTLPLHRPCAAPHLSVLPPRRSLAHTYDACAHVVEHVVE
jgi:hypothetical protein